MMYVDDCLVLGDDQMVSETVEKIKSVFSIKTKGSLEDYLVGDELISKRMMRTLGTPRYVSVSG